MDNDNKKKDLALVTAGSDLTGPLDSTSRARNRTVMLTPEMTGHMRSKMMDSPPSSGGSDWGDAPQETFGGRLIGHDSKSEDENADWTRPIEPATFSDDDEGGKEESVGHQEMSWTPAASQDSEESGDTEYTNGYHEARGMEEQEIEDNEPFVSVTNGYHAPVTSPEPTVKRAATSTPKQAPVQQEAGSSHEKMSWKQITPLAGFLVTFDNDTNGSYLPLRTGRIIVTSEAEGSGNVLLIHHETVSPQHAIMRVGSGSSVQVLDQLSESGTRVVRASDGSEELLSGEKATLHHGDIVFFGERKFHVCLIHS
jgi:hypothetical protein